VAPTDHLIAILQWSRVSHLRCVAAVAP